MKKITKKALDEVAELSSLCQRIQVKIWDYADESEYKRNAMNVADEIIDDCFKVFNSNK